MPKEAMVFLLERVKEISDGDLIVLVQFSVFNDRDTDVFKKVLNAYGIPKTLNHFSVLCGSPSQIFVNRMLTLSTVNPKRHADVVEK